MAAKYNLMPNESIILKETGVAHGGVMAIYTDELMLTNLNIVSLRRLWENYQMELNALKCIS